MTATFPPALSSDALSDAIASLQLEAIVLTRTRIANLEGLRFGPEVPGAMLHLVEQGEVEIATHSGKLLARLPSGGIGLTPRAEGLQIGPPCATAMRSLGEVSSEYHPNGFKWIRLGEGEPHTRVFTAYMSFRQRETNPILDLLVGNLWVRPDERTPEIDTLVQLLRSEMDEPRPGLRLMTENVVRLLFVTLLRTRLTRTEDLRPGLLRGLADPRLARVLGAVSAAPERDWTLDALSRTAGLSRSRLTTVFRENVGMSLFEYVRHWRVLRAKRLMVQGDDGLDAIATQVGYGSNVALSRAFKHVAGVSPGAWRRRALEPQIESAS